MTEMPCTYSGNRSETIVAYLYDDIAPLERAAFESHLSGCSACKSELDELRDVRTEMHEWSPPAFQSALVTEPAALPQRSFWREIPVWARTAAALLVVGVAAGAANINVHHDATGFTVRTGWMQRAAAPAPAVLVDQAPWRADLAKLESEIQASRASEPHVVNAVAAQPRASASDDEILRKVKTLLAESETKEENELALRIAQVVRERQAERNVDLANIQRYIGSVQVNTGFEVQRLRENQSALLERVSQTVR